MAAPLIAAKLKAIAVLGKRIVGSSSTFRRGVSSAVSFGSDTFKASAEKIKRNNRKIKVERRKQERIKDQVREDDNRRSREDRIKSNKSRSPIVNLVKNVLKKPIMGLWRMLQLWALKNLPYIIAEIRKFVKKIRIAAAMIKRAFLSVGNIFKGMFNVASAFITNIVTFDWMDSKNRLKNAQEDLDYEFGELETSFNEIKNVWGREESELDAILFNLENGDSVQEAVKNVQPTQSAFGEGSASSSTPQSPQSDPQMPGGVVSGGGSDFWTLVAVASREDSDSQGRADVAQSIYNRAMVGSAGGFYDGIRANILGRMQYEPTWRYPNGPKNGRGNPNNEWNNITDAASAARASGLPESEMKRVASDLMNPQYQKKATEFVGGKTDFRGYAVPGGVQRKSGDNYFGWYNNYTQDKTAKVPNLGAMMEPPKPQSQSRTGSGANNQSRTGSGANNQSRTSSGGMVTNNQSSNSGGMVTNNQSRTSSDGMVSNNQSSSSGVTTQAPKPYVGSISKSGSTTKNKSVLSRGDMVSGYKVSSAAGMRTHPTRGGKRNHGGLDIATPVGTYIALTVDCVVVAIANQRGGYGLLIDVWAPSLGVQFRFAHNTQVLVKRGQKIPAGTPFARSGGAKGDPNAGSSTGPHIHFEIDTQKDGTRYGGANNPKLLAKYAQFIILNRKKVSKNNVAKLSRNNTANVASITPTTAEDISKRRTTGMKKTTTILKQDHYIAVPMNA